jgi:hypothetical protein
MSASLPPPRLLGEGGKLVLEVGGFLGRATGAALVCTLPAMLRVSGALEGSAPAVRAWAALATAALAPMAIAIMVLRRARQELHTLGGPGMRLLAFGVGLWLSLLLVTFSLLGGFLRATTHHHALAGVTYAFGALALAVGWGALCARLVAVLRGAPGRVRRWGVVVFSVAALAAVAYIAVGFVSAVEHDPASAKASATVVDVLVFAAVAFFGARLGERSRWSLALVGPPVAVFLVALGITTLRDPPVREAIDDHASVFSTGAGLLSGH